MMFVSDEQILGTVGGGAAEHLAIDDAKKCRHVMRKQYILNNTRTNGTDMICGGTIDVLFIPV